MDTLDNEVEKWQFPSLCSTTSPQADSAKDNEALIHNQLKQAQEEGYDVGFRLGHEAGKEQAEKKYQTEWIEKINELRSIITVLDKPASLINDEVKNIIVHLSIQIAKHLAYQEIQKTPHSIQTLVDQVLNEVPELSSAELCCHPEQVALIKQHIEQFETLSVEPDSSLHKGECHLRSQHCQIDGRLSKRIEELSMQLLD